MPTAAESTSAEPVRERPILFSAPMVKAILAGTKTQTRRILKSPNVVDLDVFAFDAARGEWEGGIAGEGGVFAHGEYVRCPYGVPGERLWVKETFATLCPVHDCGAPEGEMACECHKVDCYRADFPDAAARWRPSIFMRREFSRIDLEVTKVRVERLQEITEADAKAEGVPLYVTGHGEISDADLHADPGFANYARHRPAFEQLWDEINGEHASWASNPFVWVVEFRRIRP